MNNTLAVRADASSGTGARLIIIFVLALMIGAGALALPLMGLANEEHANSVHPEAVEARRAMQQGKCLQMQAHYSQWVGTILMLCQLDQTQWAGQVVRVTTNTPNGPRFLDSKCYECTLFVADWRYWQNVLVRDKYDSTVPPDLLDKLWNITSSPGAYFGG